MTKFVLALLACCMFVFPCKEAQACRCRPETLESYFKKAEFVFLADIALSTKKVDVLPGQVSLEYSLLGEAYKGNILKLKELRTLRSSASCGIEPQEKAQYLVFATEDDTSGIAITHSCNGTRLFSSSKPQTWMGFQDYPAEQVLKALQMMKMNERIQRQGIGGRPLQDSIIGLLEFSAIADDVQIEKALQLHMAPKDSSETLAVIEKIEQLATREIAYELPAALVFGQKKDWFRVRSKQGDFAWIRAASGMQYHPLQEILFKRLGYLTKDWDALLWPDPGAGIPSQVERTTDEMAVKVLKFETVADSLWMQVQIYSVNPCEGGGEGGFSHAGWVPAWNPRGKLTTWFWSRGC